MANDSEQPTNTWSGVSRGAAVLASPPQRIGGYAIGEQLGEGGMGVVYAATQDRPHRSVALKLIRPGRVSAELLRRFELEAEILGRLQHPGIAHIYEAGQADLGSGPQPYFAMELIRGHGLLEFAAARKLTIRQRLELAARVADAVHYAHQQGVIHRDLKPGNIVVAADGQPKILDFGVARVTDGDVRLTTADADVPRLIGTLQYMSPEQARGKPADVDTRSDVYALGVILYELLSGRLPYDLARKPLPEAARVVAEEEPTRLSGIDRGLRGDVETIVAKALEKDKERRYASANALATDIRRFLNREPIAARPPSAMYQLSQFARRNQVLVGGVAATIIALAAGLSAALLQTREANRQAGFAAARAGEAAAAREHERKARLAAEMQTAKLARQRGEWRTALRHYESLRAAGYGDPVDVRLGIIESLTMSMHPFEALAEAESLVRDHGDGPRRADVLFAQGNLYLGLPDRHDEGVELLETALEDGLAGAPKAYAEGLLVMTVPESIAKFHDAIEQDPWMLEARVWLGWMLIASGRLEEASRELSIAQTLSPNDPKVAFATAAALALQRRLAAAHAEIDRMKEILDEAQSAALRELATVLSEVAAEVEAGRYGAVRWSESRLIGITMRCAMAVAALRMGGDDIKSAADFAWLESVMAGNYPRSLRESWGRFVQGFLRMRSAPQEARVEFEAAAEANPEGVTLFMIADYVAIEPGERPAQHWRRMADAYTRAATAPAVVSIAPIAKQLALACLVTAHKVDEPQPSQTDAGSEPVAERVELLRSIRESLVDGVPLIFGPSMVSILQSLGELELALHVALSCLSQQPDSASLHYGVAECEFQRGAYDKTIESCARALELNPKQERAVALLTRAKSMLGRIGPPGNPLPVEEYLRVRNLSPD